MDVALTDWDEAELTFGWQVDRKGKRRPTKTDGSARTIPIPQELALLLARHQVAARDTGPDAFVLATRTGRPLGQRNVQRALRQAQIGAIDRDGRPAFSILHEVDANGRPVKVPLGVLPSMHSFRHTVASRALLAGESVDEVAFLLGHRDATVTRTVYVRETLTRVVGRCVDHEWSRSTRAFSASRSTRTRIPQRNQIPHRSGN